MAIGDYVLKKCSGNRWLGIEQSRGYIAKGGRSEGLFVGIKKWNSDGMSGDGGTSWKGGLGR